MKPNKKNLKNLKQPTIFRREPVEREFRESLRGEPERRKGLIIMSRPKPKYPMVQTGFRLSESLKNEIVNRCKEEKMSLQEFIFEGVCLRMVVSSNIINKAKKQAFGHYIDLLSKKVLKGGIQ